MKLEYRSLLRLLIGWEILILIFFAVGIKYLPLQANYLGGSVHYSEIPLLWSHANYDGEHYLEIAQFGYGPFRYFFFPLFPVLIRFISHYLLFVKFPLPWAGILITQVSFFVAFIVLYKLLRIDYSEKFSKRTILLLLLFPASFYFTGIYTEGVFLALSVATFYFARKQNWLAAGVLGMFASATRIIGLVLFISILYEWFVEYRNNKVRLISVLPILLIPLGLVLYMIYLKGFIGDPLAFFHNISTYGDQRSDHFVVLPQVFYRYIFKILPNVGSYLPILLTTYFEFITGALFLILAVLSFFKLRKSYFLFFALGYLIPTLTGSFSSMPRYMLVLFPSFITLTLITDKWSRRMRYLLYGLFIVFLAVFTSMFVVGYWVS